MTRTITVYFLALPVLLSFEPALDGKEPEDRVEKAASRFAKLDDVRVHYKAIGSGSATIVFIHGWACDLTCWHSQFPAFAGNSRVLLIDLPGHGRSDKPKIDYSMDLFARSIDAVMKDAGAESAVLVGHSMGAPVVRQFYRLFPKKTRALVLADGTLLPFLTRKEDVDRAAERLSGPAFEKNLEEMIEGMFAAPTPAEVRKKVKDVMQRVPRHVAASALRGMCDPALGKEDEIKAPVQVITAKARVWPASYQQYLRKIAPRLDYQTMEGVGHFLMLEKPKVFNSLLANFLQQGLSQR